MKSGDLKWVVTELSKTLFHNAPLSFLLNSPPAESRPLPTNSLIFKWFAYPLTKAGKGEVYFSTPAGAQAAQSAFSTSFDSHLVTTAIHSNILYLSNLNPVTDELYLVSKLSPYGEIVHVQLEKQRMEEHNNAERMLGFLICEVLGRTERFQVEYVRKMGDGLRVAKVRMYGGGGGGVGRVCEELN